MNKELYELYRDPPIMNEIKSGRLRWAGHVERSMEGSLLKKDIYWEARRKEAYRKTEEEIDGKYRRRYKGDG